MSTRLIVMGVVIAIILDAMAYRKLASGAAQKSSKGIVLSILAGVLMGFFYSYVARAIGATTMANGASMAKP